MARYLSDEWWNEVATVSGASNPGMDDLVLQHRVTGGPDGDVWYYVRLSADGLGAAVVPGRAEHPQITFCEDFETAAAVAQGHLGAPAALLSGQIRVAGDLAALLDGRERLPVGDLMPAAVRASTEF
ncbi:MAG: hypothetical protein ACRDZ8_03490 [Acidimicrobiales bacterium]